MSGTNSNEENNNANANDGATGTGGTAKGGYVLSGPPNGLPLQALLFGTGSETHLAVKAQELLAAEKIGAQVISMPCWELFLEQPQSYRDQVIPPQVTTRVSVEAGIRQGWDQFIGHTGKHIGMTTFGASAPYEKIYADRGITAEAVVKAVKG